MGETTRITANPCRITRCRMLARIIIIILSSLLSPPLSLSPSLYPPLSLTLSHPLFPSHAYTRVLPAFLPLPPSLLPCTLFFFFSLSRCYFSRFISLLVLWLSLAQSHIILSLSLSLVLRSSLSASRARVHPFVPYEKDSKPNT